MQGSSSPQSPPNRSRIVLFPRIMKLVCFGKREIGMAIPISLPFRAEGFSRNVELPGQGLVSLDSVGWQHGTHIVST